jgi:hypothetical protein
MTHISKFRAFLVRNGKEVACIWSTLPEILAPHPPKNEGIRIKFGFVSLRHSQVYKITAILFHNHVSVHRNRFSL